MSGGERCRSMAVLMPVVICGLRRLWFCWILADLSAALLLFDPSVGLIEVMGHFSAQFFGLPLIGLYQIVSFLEDLVHCLS